MRPLYSKAISRQECIAFECFCFTEPAVTPGWQQQIGGAMCIAVPVHKVELFDWEDFTGFGYKVMFEFYGTLKPLFPEKENEFADSPTFFRYAKNVFKPFTNKTTIENSLSDFNCYVIAKHYIQGFNFFFNYSVAIEYLLATGYELNPKVTIYKIYYEGGIGGYKIPNHLVGNGFTTRLCTEFTILRKVR